MHALLKEIKAARTAIWQDEPTDIGRLRMQKGARNQGASVILYATMKLGQLVTSLNHLRTVAKRGGVDLKTMKVITEHWLEFYANTYDGFYRMTDTARVVREAKTALQNVETLEEYTALIEEVSLYVGRMDYWVDQEIPWAKFGEAYEQTRR
jgi:hypothetical protein